MAQVEVQQAGGETQAAPKGKNRGKGESVAKAQTVGTQVAVAAPQDSGPVIGMILRAASDPSVDIVKFERLMEMHKDMEAQARKNAYDAALADMQSELPVIGRRGRIEVRAKDAQGNRTGELQQSTGYALWEDINEAIKPVLKKYHFSLSFRVGQTAEGKITVTGILAREGHREETTITLMHDSTGSKNSVQAVGSSTSYGKRYTASALLNLTSRGEDDDGKKAGEAEPVNAEQLAELIRLADAAGADKRKFCEVMEVDSFASIPAKRYAEAVKQLNRKLAARQKAKGGEA